MSQLSASKAAPLSRDIKAMVITNVIAVVSGVAFAAMGLGIFHVAVGL